MVSKPLGGAMTPLASLGTALNAGRVNLTVADISMSAMAVRVSDRAVVCFQVGAPLPVAAEYRRASGGSAAQQAGETPPQTGRQGAGASSTEGGQGARASQEAARETGEEGEGARVEEAQETTGTRGKTSSQETAEGSGEKAEEEEEEER